MRYQNWPQRLHDTIKAASGRPFLWGETDCCLFAADCSVAICGVDPAEQYRGHYTTEIGAKRKLHELHGGLEAVCDAYFERVSIALRQRGDFVLFDGPMGKSIGVVWAGGIWATTDDGVARVKAEPLICWRVEHG